MSNFVCFIVHIGNNYNDMMINKGQKKILLSHTLTKRCKYDTSDSGIVAVVSKCEFI